MSPEQVRGPVAASSRTRRQLHLQPRQVDREQTGMTSLILNKHSIGVFYR
jgi:hypothetical protein